MAFTIDNAATSATAWTGSADRGCADGVEAESGARGQDRPGLTGKVADPALWYSAPSGLYRNVPGVGADAAGT